MIITQIIQLIAIFLIEFFKYGLNWQSRIDLIKNISRRLESLNIFYVKVLQTICIDQNILTEDEKDYLIKYTDSVPYQESDIDYGVLNRLHEDYNIVLDDIRPINAGIVGIVFQATLQEEGVQGKEVVIKLLKHGIRNKIIEAFEVASFMAQICVFIPKMKYLNLLRIIEDNREILLDQTVFSKEVHNLSIFREKFINMPEFVIPYVYHGITKEYPDVIVMENIKGIHGKKYGEVLAMDQTDKDAFGRLISRFVFISILYNSAIHCDLHAGNMFFYKEKEKSEEKEKEKSEEKEKEKEIYKLGIIDFGICSFPSRESQNYYYQFIYKTQVLKIHKGIFKASFFYFTEPKTRIAILTPDEIDEIEAAISYGIVHYVEKHAPALFFAHINKNLNKYGMYITSEFNRIILSIYVNNSILTNLFVDAVAEEMKVFDEFVRISDW